MRSTKRLLVSATGILLSASPAVAITQTHGFQAASSNDNNQKAGDAAKAKAARPVTTARKNVATASAKKTVPAAGTTRQTITLPPLPAPPPIPVRATLPAATAAPAPRPAAPPTRTTRPPVPTTSHTTTSGTTPRWDNEGDDDDRNDHKGRCDDGREREDDDKAKACTTTTTAAPGAPTTTAAPTAPPTQATTTTTKPATTPPTQVTTTTTKPATTPPTQATTTTTAAPTTPPTQATTTTTTKPTTTTSSTTLPPAPTTTTSSTTLPPAPTTTTSSTTLPPPPTTTTTAAPDPSLTLTVLNTKAGTTVAPPGVTSNKNRGFAAQATVNNAGAARNVTVKIVAHAAAGFPGFFEAKQYSGTSGIVFSCGAYQEFSVVDATFTCTGAMPANTNSVITISSGSLIDAATIGSDWSLNVDVSPSNVSKASSGKFS